MADDFLVAKAIDGMAAAINNLADSIEKIGWDKYHEESIASALVNLEGLVSVLSEAAKSHFKRD